MKEAQPSSGDTMSISIEPESIESSGKNLLPNVKVRAKSSENVSSLVSSTIKTNSNLILKYVS